ncbi:Aminopeptidase Y [Komagataella phaffii CBS 7435]|uniref:Peptide hydrolase n=2 Tax=Komagataella phaffii TaxID=460519 RepID=C4QYZ6_KOMPG|nr:Vacuolar aminopeptidase Y, processed to mature form by Prb1p [Komagataella phaffii GS115]AOA60397.1 GQ67_01529T0 [Komagataella phaffii]CAH2447296.1 Aminopeptidase Y [Komagataella phaffii CBS 7435]AOA65576.1 GQ68_01545T0 [Komagataella phaffii GS115]CAY68470.1 Vacuolar aminopeptidase Y, processed to mature form by Prb1p [Komagataella phaffii GS115]CCA37536.1 Aminopeptidase Y [Komagataella phaffii CBS 7435]
MKYLPLVATLASSALAAGINFAQLLDQKPLDIADNVKWELKPEVDSAALQSAVNELDLKIEASYLFKVAHGSVFEYGHPTRVIGSPGHWSTINHVLDTLHNFKHYYDVDVQPFEAFTGILKSFSLTINGVAPKSAEALDLTPPTPGGFPVTGPVVLVDNYGCQASDYPFNVTNGIALIQRGSCSFGQKSELAGLRGAKAALIYNNVPGSAKGTLGAPTPHQVPSLSLSQEDGEAVKRQLLTSGSVIATVAVDSYVKKFKTKNVIATTRYGNDSNIVMLGAHSDSVAAGPGINDDGSGTISLLNVAKYLTKFKVNNKVRFAWWAAEEEGLLGSDYYVSKLTPKEKSQIRLFMDYDMMASPNYAYQVYNATNSENPVGSEELKNLYIDWYVEQGLNYTLVPFDGRSDYDGFIKSGIPGGGIATGAEGLKTEEEAELFGGEAGVAYDPCYHSLCDDLANPDYVPWVVNTKLIAHSVATYAKSLDGFPLREEPSPFKMTAQSNFKYHGPKLVL